MQVRPKPVQLSKLNCEELRLDKNMAFHFIKYLFHWLKMLHKNIWKVKGN